MKTIYSLLLSLFFCMGMQAQDWANLQRFQKSNQEIGAPAKGEKRVVFMGNSITEGWIRTCPEFFNKTKISRGISGQTTPQMLIRFRQDVIELQPKAVVILAGTNDIAGNTGPSTIEMIENNLASMAELAKAHNIKVILCSILPVYDYPWAKDKQPIEKIAAINKWMKQYAKANKMTFLDLFTPLADDRQGMKSEYSKDGVHPNRKGYDVMMPLVEKAIKEVL